MLVSQALARAQARRPAAIPLEFPVQSNPGRHGADGETRLINCYMENIGKEGKTPYPIYAADGFSLFSTLTGGGGTRGMISTETLLFVVSGRLLFAVDSTGTIQTIGGVPDEGPVFFSKNRANPQQIVLTTTNGLKYVITNTSPTPTIAEITDTDLPSPNSNDFIDGYTLYGIRDGRVFFSAIDDAATIDALDYFEAEGSPDKLKRVFVHKRTIFLLGDDTTELWDSVGDATNPFQRSPGGYAQFGLMATASVASLGENVVLIDSHGRVVEVNASGAVRRISTYAVERSIDDLSLSDKALIEGFVHHHRGHEIYVLSGSGFTWAYDLTTGLWHERVSQGETRWRAAYHAFFAGKHILGDFESAYLYEESEDVYDENDAEMIATIRFPIHAWPDAIALNRLRVDMIPGVGLNSADLHLSDPQLMMRLSRNGGKSYGNSYSRSIGKIGEYTASTEFSKCGSSNEDGFIVELSVSAAVIRGFTGLSGDIRKIRR